MCAGLSLVHIHTPTHTHIHTGESFVLSYPPDIDEANKQLIAMAWQSEFLPISNALLKRLQTQQSMLEPLSTEDHYTLHS